MLRNRHCAPYYYYLWIPLLIVALTSAFFFAGPAHPARAASYTVTSNADTGHACSGLTAADNNTLRYALCNATVAGDVITIQADIATITLQAILPTIYNDKNSGGLTIHGNGAVIDGASQYGVFYVDYAGGLNIVNLTIQNGRGAPGCSSYDLSYTCGGAIYNLGTVTVNNSTFSGNSVVWGGGAIYSIGILTVSSSTFSHNLTTRSGVSRGGAISDEWGTVTVSSSTFFSNHAGGGMDWACGGAISTFHGTVTVSSSTFSGNVGHFGGAIYNTGTVTVSNSTLADTIGTAIYTYTGNIRLNNTLLSNSSCEGTPSSNGAIYNLANDNSCGAGVTYVSTGLNLGALGYWGGPTQTIPLLPGSPAINHGETTVCNNAPVSNVDQRGMARLTNAACDIGAFETVSSGVVTHFSITAPVSTVAGTPLTYTVTALDDSGNTVTSYVNPVWLISSDSQAVLTPSTYAFPPTDNGTHTFTDGVTLRTVGTQTLTVTDVFNGIITGSGSIQVQDPTPPTVTITAQPTNPTSSTSASFTFSGSDNATPAALLTFQCSLDGGTVAACISPQTYTGLADGSHAFSVTATDQVGNVSAPATYTWVVDGTLPTVSITTHPASVTNSASAVFTFTGNDGTGSGVASYQCSLDGSPAACTSPQTYNALADGSHAFAVTATDNAGNVSAPATYTWVVDTTAPTVTLNSQPASVTNSDSAAFTFTGNDGTGSGVASYQCSLDGGAYASCTSGQTYNGLGNGPHTFSVTATDNVGNVTTPATSYTWTIDTILPGVTITAQPPSVTNNTSASFTFIGTDPGGSGIAGYQCQLDGAAATACTSPQTYASLTPGAHTFSVTVTNNAGSTSAPATYNWTIDTVQPTIALSSAAPDPTNTAPIPVTVTFSKAVTGFDDTDITVTNGTVTTGSFQAISSTVYTFTVTPSGASPVMVTVTIAAGVAVDSANNPNLAAAPLSRTYDSSMAGVTITRTDASPTNASAVRFTVTFSKDVTGLSLANFALAPGGNVQYAALQTLSSVTAHEYTVTVGTGAGDGTLGLNMVNSTGVTDSAANPVGGLPAAGQVYTIRKTPDFPTPPPVPLCNLIGGGTDSIVQANVPADAIPGGSIFCRVLEKNGQPVNGPEQIGNQSVVQRGVIQAVDVFGLLTSGTPVVPFSASVQVCLQGSGTFLFLDAAQSPRTVSTLPATSQSGYTCANIPNAGTVVLVSGPAAPVANPVTPLAACQVTTTDMVNLRSEPNTGAAVLNVVPYNTVLRASAKSGDWYQVVYSDDQGWINARYLTIDPICGQ